MWMDLSSNFKHKYYMLSNSRWIFFKYSSHKFLIFYLTSNEEIDTVLSGRAPSFLNLYEPVYLKK